MIQLPFAYQIRRSQRAQNARIVVSASKIEVVVPLRMSERVIRKFVYDKRNWINNTLGKLELHQQTIKKQAPDIYHEGVKIPFQGKKYPLTIRSHRLKKVKIEFAERFTAFVPETSATDRSELIRAALIKWVFQQATIEAEKLLTKHVALHQLQPRSIRIKTQKSRWGSCGIHNDINLNWVLMLAPAAVFEYVLVHELCHIKQRNHSVHFWRLVAEHMPDYQQQRTWLKDNGAMLMLGL